MSLQKYPSERLVSWPIVPGDYRVGSRLSPVAVLVIGTSEGVRLEERALVDAAVEAGAAIAGICKTANIGLERVILNIVSNPNIRYLVVTGLDDNAHHVGHALLCLALGKYDSSRRKIECPLAKDAYLSNLTPEIIDRFMKQVQIVIAIPVSDTAPVEPKHITVGSRTFRIPCEHNGSSLRVYVTRDVLVETVKFLVHSCLQERECAVNVTLVTKYGEFSYVLYDPGAYPEPPISTDLLRTVQHTAQPQAELAVTSSAISTTPVMITAAQQSGFTVYLPVHVPVIDLGWIVIARFRNIRDAYEFLKNYILQRGVERPTRHGDTREICAIEIIEEHPWFVFREEDGRVIVEDFDFSYVEESSYPIKSKDYFREYVQDLLNGVWRDPGKVHYSYGALLRRYGLDIHVFLPKLVQELGLEPGEVETVQKLFSEDGKLVVDQLRELIRNMLKMPLERCFVVTLWQPVLDTACRRAQPCFTALDFKIVPFDGEWRLELTCLMRSHDFLNAHAENYYALAGLLQYVVWKLRQLAQEELQRAEEEKRRHELEMLCRLRPGRIIWVITSCHIYKKHVGLS